MLFTSSSRSRSPRPPWAPVWTTTIRSTPQLSVSTDTTYRSDRLTASSEGLFIIIASVVLICLFFLLGHTFGYVLLIILVVLSVALLFVYFTRRPLFVSVFGLRPTTSVKVPKYAFRVIPAQQLTLNNNNTGVDASANSGFYVYPYPNISPSPVYTTQTTTKNHYWLCCRLFLTQPKTKL